MISVNFINRFGARNKGPTLRRKRSYGARLDPAGPATCSDAVGRQEAGGGTKILKSLRISDAITNFSISSRGPLRSRVRAPARPGG
jgi:hypothetical protein